ncbi:hypothetical protein ACFSC6_20995 [Rufibacter sediminis]|uniref:Uncharacterized protein n=1 Tax=Rufibacter sediminis TaxID=2762756 RepID=A0ABR6VSB4_9BACT|nr:hypothetical protein [Rufibacter sediminis]MBC3539814.1 hypothetical protein [Rufibacter sediminis]
MKRGTVTCPIQSLKGIAKVNTRLCTDTIKLYGRKIELTYLRSHPAFKFRGYEGNNILFDIVCPITGYSKPLKYHAPTKSCTWEIALPRLVHPTNGTLLTLTEATEAIELLMEHTGLNLLDFQICRLDITHDITFSPTSFRAVRGHLKAPSYWQPERIDYKDSYNFAFSTTPNGKTGRAEKFLLFYAKEGKTRIELRLFSSSAMKRALGLARSLTMADILTEGFIDKANAYFAQTIEQVTSKNGNPLAKGLKRLALAALPEAVLC